MRKSREGLERRPCSTEQCREVDPVRAKERRCNNTDDGNTLICICDCKELYGSSGVKRAV